MEVSRRIAIHEAEDEVEVEVERMVALLHGAGDRGALDDTRMRQALQRIASSCDKIEQISASCAAARETFKAAMLRPSDLRLRQRFHDALADLRMSVREARRALTTEWPAVEPTEIIEPGA